MDHILVEWINENPKQFSVCRVSDIVDGDLRSLGQKLEGRITSIQWKRRDYPGKILKIGVEEELEEMADDLAAEEHQKDVTPKKKAKVGGSRRSKPRQDQLRLKSSITEVLSTLPTPLAPMVELEGNAEVSADQNEDSTAEKNEETKAEKYKRKLKELKSKYRNLKEKYNNLVAETNLEEMVELMPNTGVRIKKADLDKMRLVSNQVTVLARNLFRHFFTLEELASHSLYGKKCNANKTDADPLPEIEAVRRDAIINYILKINGLDEEDRALDKEFLVKRKGVKREITKTLSDFLREEHRKLNRQ